MKRLARIMALIHEKKISQAEVARRMGIKQPTLSRMLRGNMGIENLEKIAQILDVPVSALMESEAPPGWKMMPVIGRVPAGVPFEAVEDFDGEIPVPDKHAQEGYFALRVHGDSMSPKFEDGDVVIVAPVPDPVSGDVVVTRINHDGEVTLKRFRRQGGAVVLVPDNPAHSPIILSVSGDVKILGKVVGLYRTRF